MDNINATYNNYKFSSCLILMTISFFITFWLGIYFDNVLPSAYGLRKKWYFCFTKSYWFGNGDTRARIHQRRPTEHDTENLKDDDFESKDKKKENFEPASRDLKQQESDNKMLKIADLKKTFDNGF